MKDKNNNLINIYLAFTDMLDRISNCCSIQHSYISQSFWTVSQRILTHWELSQYLANYYKCDINHM